MSKELGKMKAEKETGAKSTNIAYINKLIDTMNLGKFNKLMSRELSEELDAGSLGAPDEYANFLGGTIGWEVYDDLAVTLGVFEFTRGKYPIGQAVREALRQSAIPSANMGINVTQFRESLKKELAKSCARYKQ